MPRASSDDTPTSHAAPTARPTQEQWISEEEIRRDSPRQVSMQGPDMRTTLSAAGAGVVNYQDLALNRFVFDPTLEQDGYFIYLRDLDDGTFWSATLQPDVLAPDAYAASLDAARCRFDRRQNGIRSVLDVSLLPNAPIDLRVLHVCNESARTRRLDVTSYLEIVLNDPVADHAHPAFSRLFVQTRYDPEQHALRAWRRRRSPDERPAHLLHAAHGDGDAAGFESSRPDFLGRARNTRNPIGLTRRSPLDGTDGSVLDPVAVLRRNLVLEPGQVARVWFLLGAGRSAHDIEALLSHSTGLELPRAMPPEAPCLGAGGPRGASMSRPPGPPHGVAYTPLKRRNPDDAPENPDRDAEERLQFFNGYGGFAPTGDEYVIRMPYGEDGRHRYPPQPWTNVIANESVGFIVSERGAGCTWSRNSRENRLTPWFNDFVADPHGEAFFVRDEAARTFWSIVPGPAPAPVPYETRHGLGYSVFRHQAADLEIEATQFVDRQRPVKVTHVRVRNHAEHERTLSLFGYVELVLGDRLERTRAHTQVSFDQSTGAVRARTRLENEFHDQHVFAAVRGPGPVGATTDRARFLGRLGSVENPEALTSAAWLEMPPAPPADPCAALQIQLTLAPGDEVECAFLLGDADDEQALADLLHEFSAPAAWTRAREEVARFWHETTSRLQIHTPVPELDLMVNHWLPYQNLSCRIWGRSAFYQSGGAFGFRDQLQDSAGLLYLDPNLTRQQILLHAAHQFVEGDVMHWWHPPTGKGIRTRFSDDLLWLPYITAFFVQSTGDHGILDEDVPYLTAQLLEPGEDEVFLAPRISHESGTLYDHCCRAIDRSLATGRHGLPLMGTGDWNDGMNRVGREGRGESVWLGFFLYDILGRFLPLVNARGDSARAEGYRRHRQGLFDALNGAGWDGEWYRRAYYDNGEPLGARESDECRIDALAQAWAVMSGAAPADRVEQALDALEQHLVDEDAGLIRLLTPAFDQTPNDPGYIKGYVPGVRENGGQYTHGVLWAVRALAEAGRGDRAADLLRMLSPVSHTRTRAQTERYRVEPYVIAADVYGEPPHVGRGGWTWYTGSAAWMYRVAVESVLGLRLDEGSHLVLDPRIHSDWPSCSLTYRLPDATTYRILIRNPHGAMHGVAQATLDDRPVETANGTARIPLLQDAGLHTVEIELSRP